MYEPLLSPKEKHYEAGIYEEESIARSKLNHMQTPVVQEEMKEIDQQIELEYKESIDWNNEMYKDFQDPAHPTVIELLDKSTETLNGINKLKDDLIFFYTEERMKVLLVKLFEVMGNLTKQFEMLSEICKAREASHDFKALHSKYLHLGDLGMNLETKPKICFRVLARCIDYLLKNLLLDLHKTVQHLSEKRGTTSNSVKANEIQILTAKIKVVSEYLPLAASFDNNDIFALEETHPYRQDLMKHVEVKTLGTTEKIKKSFKKFIQGILVGVSMVSKGAQQENIVAKKLTVSFGAVYYFFASVEAQKQANLFYSQPETKTAFQTWNMLEDEFIAGMMKISLPSIKFAEKVYINKMYDPITLDLVNSALRAKTLNTLAPLKYDIEPNNQSEEVTTLKIQNCSPHEVKIKGLDKIPILVLSNRNLSIRKYTELHISQRPNSKTAGIKTEIVAEKHIEVPVHHEHKPEIPRPRLRENQASCGLFDFVKGFGCFGGDDEVLPPDFDGLVIHIHGGGFVSMSSGSHQSYTRQWSKILRKPVFSIDYRLAPEFPYPAALDDCWQAYNWILNYAEEVLGVQPSRVILAGDSSGANLALGVTTLAMKCGVRPPDGLFLAYPALRLETRAYSPSLMLALDDQLIPYSLLKLCMQAYVPPGGDPTNDPLLSPTHLSEEILKKLPPIRMIVGDSDPLHDECWRFTDKLRKLGKDVFLTVYKDMCHGFLGYDVPMGMPESKICIRDSAEMIGELLKGTSVKRRSTIEKK